MDKRVLVVDDEECVAELVTQALEGGGYAVQTAADGQAALDKVESFEPHLVVLDVIMPKENGYRVSRTVKTREGLTPEPAPRVLLVTGRRLDDDPEREKMFMEFSMADGILYKPFDIHVLLERVHELIGDPASNPG